MQPGGRPGNCSAHEYRSHRLRLCCGFLRALFRQLSGAETGSAAYDRDPNNLDRFARRSSTRPYADFEAFIGDPEIELVLNLTNPRSHCAVTRRGRRRQARLFGEAAGDDCPGCDETGRSPRKKTDDTWRRPPAAY